MTIFCINLGWAVTLLTVELLLRGHGAKGLAVAYLSAEAGRVTASLIYATRSSNKMGDRPIPSGDGAISVERVSESSQSMTS